jgi:hypothetical protein
MLDRVREQVAQDRGERGRTPSNSSSLASTVMVMPGGGLSVSTTSAIRSASTMGSALIARRPARA